MEERLAREFGTNLEALNQRHYAILQRRYPDLHEPNENIRKFAEKIPGDGPEEIKALMEAAAGNLFPRRLVSREDAERLYLRRTAGEILESQRVATHPESGIHGCQDFALVTLALLRAKQIQDVEFIRLLPRPVASRNTPFQANHSILIATFGEKKYRIDMSRKKPFVPITDKKIQELKRYALCGRDSFDVGITSAANAFQDGKGKPNGEKGKAIN